jgi:hypothetical protein
MVLDKLKKFQVHNCKITKGQVCQHLPDQPIVRSEDLPVHVNVIDTSSDGESLSDEDKDENGNPKGYKCLGTFVIPR